MRRSWQIWLVLLLHRRDLIFHQVWRGLAPPLFFVRSRWLGPSWSFSSPLRGCWCSRLGQRLRDRSKGSVVGWRPNRHRENSSNFPLGLLPNPLPSCLTAIATCKVSATNFIHSRRPLEGRITGGQLSLSPAKGDLHSRCEEMQGQMQKRRVTEHISGRDVPGVPEQETFRHPS